MNLARGRAARHRPGTHGVPAGRRLGAPDPRPRVLRLGRRAVVRPRVRRGVSRRDAGGGAAVLPRRHPGDARGAAARLRAVAGPGRAADPADRDRAPCPSWSSARSTTDAVEDALRTPLVGGHRARRRRGAAARRSSGWRARQAARNRSPPPARSRSAPRRRVALIPGVSRSGATIVAGMALGLRREAAARFSFLLSMPTIARRGRQGGARAAARHARRRRHSLLRRRHAHVGRRRLFP